MRVLHLVDPSSPGGGACTLRLLGETVRRMDRLQHDVLIIGTADHVKLARRCGVEPLGAISPLLRHAALAAAPLRRLIDRRAHLGERYGIIHAWTASSAVLAWRAAPHTPMLATLSIGPVGQLAPHLLAHVLRQHPMPLLATSEGVKREYACVGVARTMLSVVPPAVNPQDLEASANQSNADSSSPAALPRGLLRRRWGVSEQTFVVAALSEPMRWADARCNLNAAAMVCYTGRDLRIVIHPRAEGRLRVMRWISRIGLADMVILDDDAAEPWRIVNGLEAGLLMGGPAHVGDQADIGSPSSLCWRGGRLVRPMPGVMPLLWAMAAGLPVVAEAGDAVRGIVHDGVTGLLVSQADIAAAAERLVELVDDRDLCRRLGTAARQTVNASFHVRDYGARLEHVYHRVARGLPALVPSSEPQTTFSSPRSVPATARA